MAVAYDNSVTTHDFGVTSVTTGSFTISGTNRSACLGLTYYANITSVTGSCGGQTASLLTGSDNWNGVTGGRLMSVIAPASGSQTATASWTTAAGASLGVITAQGVDQTTPMNGGVFTSAFGTPQSRSVTSTSGDLTVTNCGTDTSNATQTTNQTKKTTDFGCMDIGPGTGNTTHTWSDTATGFMISGGNFVQVAASDTLFGQACL